MARPAAHSRRSESGVVAVVVALVTCLVLVPVAALAVDIGTQRGDEPKAGDNYTAHGFSPYSLKTKRLPVQLMPSPGREAADSLSGP